MTRLQWLDLRATLRERKTWLAAAMLLYAVVSIPVLFERPPPHVLAAVQAWFASDDPFALFMYLWIDLVMNKAIAFLPVVMASGVVLRERDLGSLVLVASKPIGMSRYFVLRAMSACLAMAILYIATQLLGALWFSMQVAGFHARPFLLAMVPNLFAATFATALAAACAAWVRRRVAAALVALGITTTLVGMALVGYYQPAWRAWANLNPIAVGASALGRLDHLDVLGTLVPAGTLVLATAAMLWLGSIGARRLAVLS